jgi:phytoene dehydrogenase-like protein
MAERHVLIIGGGLAGLAAGCYARVNGFRTTVVEHNVALGGVCTAWSRGPYVIDGCIQWLTGGPFHTIYQELGLVPRIALRTIEELVTYRDARDGLLVAFGRNLEATGWALRDLAPEDTDEINRMIDGANHLVTLKPGIDQPAELSTVRSQLTSLWHARNDLGVIAHFRQPMHLWAKEHLRSARLRQLLSRIVPEEASALFLLMVLGYLKEGYLSRPVGGSARFRDGMIDTYSQCGGETRLQSTVEEVLVSAGRARGVRLVSGEEIHADIVISTSSTPETVLRLLGGRHGANETQEHLERWTLFPPIVLASYGVGTPLPDAPQRMVVDHVAPLTVGGVQNDHLDIRVFHDEPSYAPPGHTVVQVKLRTDFEHWSTRGARYQADKDELAKVTLARLSEVVPGLSCNAEMSDVATPLTFWNKARSWKGAYEGWMPNGEAFFSPHRRTLPGLTGFYMAGQWIEPGGGVPAALMSGRQAAQVICADEGRAFVSSVETLAWAGRS